MLDIQGESTEGDGRALKPAYALLLSLASRRGRGGGGEGYAGKDWVGVVAEGFVEYKATGDV